MRRERSIISDRSAIAGSRTVFDATIDTEPEKSNLP
jgi:hypothetical protein